MECSAVHIVSTESLIETKGRTHTCPIFNRAYQGLHLTILILSNVFEEIKYGNRQ